MFTATRWAEILFSTLHDSSVAEILANKQLTHYLSTEIDALSEKLHLKFTSIIESKLLQWTESKVSLVEFIYALYAGKCFNNGNTNLKEIAFCCETLLILRLVISTGYFLKSGTGRKAGHNFWIN